MVGWMNDRRIKGHCESEIWGSSSSTANNVLCILNCVTLFLNTHSYLPSSCSKTSQFPFSVTARALEWKSCEKHEDSMFEALQKCAQNKEDPNRKLFTMATFYLEKGSIYKIPENLTLRRTSHISVLDVQRRDKLIPNPQISQLGSKMCVWVPWARRGEMHLSESPQTSFWHKSVWGLLHGKHELLKLSWLLSWLTCWIFGKKVGVGGTLPPWLCYC